MIVRFEDWLSQRGDYRVLSYKDGLKEAYEAGFNACRDKWGGIGYQETVEWFYEEEKAK